MKDDYATNSHYFTNLYISLLEGWENVLFELGSERICRLRIVITVFFFYHMNMARTLRPLPFLSGVCSQTGKLRSSGVTTDTMEQNSAQSFLSIPRRTLGVTGPTNGIQ